MWQDVKNQPCVAFPATLKHAQKTIHKPGYRVGLINPQTKPKGGGAETKKKKITVTIINDEYQGTILINNYSHHYALQPLVV